MIDDWTRNTAPAPFAPYYTEELVANSHYKIRIPRKAKKRLKKLGLPTLTPKLMKVWHTTPSYSVKMTGISYGDD